MTLTRPAGSDEFCLWLSFRELVALVLRNDRAVSDLARCADEYYERANGHPFPVHPAAVAPVAPSPTRPLAPSDPDDVPVVLIGQGDTRREWPDRRKGNSIDPFRATEPASVTPVPKDHRVPQLQHTV